MDPITALATGLAEGLLFVAKLREMFYEAAEKQGLTQLEADQALARAQQQASGSLDAAEWAELGGGEG